MIETHAIDMSCTNTLPNEAQIIGRILLKSDERDPVWIMLCYRVASVQPYATWCVDAEGNAFWGHYFAAYSDAEADYMNRIQRGY